MVTGILDCWYGCREDRKRREGRGITYYGNTVTRKGVKAERGEEERREGKGEKERKVRSEE